VYAMTEEISVKFEVTRTDEAFCEIWDQPLLSGPVYGNIAVLVVIFAALNIYSKHSIPWQHYILFCALLLASGFLVKNLKQWIVVQGRFRHALAKTGEVVDHVELTLSEKGLKYNSEKYSGPVTGPFDWEKIPVFFEWRAVGEVLQTPYGIRILAGGRAGRSDILWVPLVVEPMAAMPGIVELLRLKVENFKELREPPDPRSRADLAKFLGKAGVAGKPGL